MLSLFRYLRPYNAPVAVILVLLLAQTLAELYLPTLMADIIDTGVVRGDVPYIWRVGGLMLAVAGLSGLTAVIGTYLSARVAVGFGRDVREKVFTRATAFTLREFDRFGTSTLITRATNDVTQVQTVTMMILRVLVSAPIMAVGGIIMALGKDRTLTLVLVVAVPVLALLIALVALKAVPLFRAMQVKLDTLNRVLREGLTGIRVIRAFDRVAYESDRFTAANVDLTWTAVRVNRLMAFIFPAVMLVMNFTTLAIVWFGGIRIDAGAMQVGDMMAFIQYAMQIMFSVMMVAMMFVMLPRAQASAVRINEVLAVTPEIADPADDENPTGPRGLVEFDNVTFSYPGAEEPAVSNLSFTARPGQVTAIIGGTGAGKSTLINLIPRFYDVQSGSVRVAGVDVRFLTQAELRSRIGFVPQQAVLFTGSIADNVRWGRDDATDEEVRRAIETSQAAEFVDENPEGLRAQVSQGGTNLSGGQKQRLAIARALVRRPEVYVFDDSFSALDYRTDARLRAALRRDTRDSTVIIVAQRVSTIRDADQIVVLDDGRIVGRGTHDELMASSPTYREIAQSQLSEKELA